jgi:CheY-like chemotaxis protein
MRVLIVEDDLGIRTMMRDLLRSEGWDTDVAASGNEALQRLDEFSTFDAIVLDYRMPGLTGIELARNMREEGLEPPIIICSAYLSPQIEKEAESLGVPTVNKKDLRLLVDMVRQHAGPQ